MSTVAVLRERLHKCRLASRDYRSAPAWWKPETLWTYRFLNAKFYLGYKSQLSTLRSDPQKGRAFDGPAPTY